MKIIKASQPILITQMKVLEFGTPGSRKTSFALTAKDPLMLDFDRGSHRAYTRSDAVEINTWADVLDILKNKDDLKPYKTLVLDTLGKALDMLASFIISENGKLATGGGTLTLQGYGVRRAYFKAFMDKAGELGLDIVMVAHDKEEKVDDVLKVRPDIGGGSYGDILKDVDLCAYMEVVKGVYTISFDPSERAIGKNCAGFKTMNIEKTSMDFIITEAKRVLNERNQGNLEVLEEITELKNKVANIETLDDANMFMDSMKDISSDVVKQQIRKVFTEKTISLGFAFDGPKGQGTNQYILKVDYKPATQSA